MTNTAQIQQACITGSCRVYLVDPATTWAGDGRFVRVQVADPDGYRVEVYAHY
jgi:hypothetical protein